MGKSSLFGDIAKSHILGADIDENDNVLAVGIIDEISKIEYFRNNGFYGQNTKVAVIETGKAFMEHDYFAQSNFGGYYESAGTLTDYTTAHATMVSSVIAALEAPDDKGNRNYIAIGLAFGTTLFQSSVTTELIPYIDENGDQKYNTDTNALVCYDTFKHYASVEKVDAVNMSWGFPDLTIEQDAYSQIVDSIVRAASKTVFVIAAGNDGPETNTVCSPALSFNSISVGALGNPVSYDSIAEFSSRGASDFYNPITKETVKAVRASVDICAPGAGIAGAYYDEKNPANASLYGVAGGTSFSAPIVTSVVSLLDSVSYYLEENNPDNWSVNARDARVIKAVLLNSADKPSDWNNGQTLSDNVTFKHVQIQTGLYADITYDNVLVTTQALDFSYGAGILNAENALKQYAEQNNKRAWIFASVGVNSDGWVMLSDISAGDDISTTLVWFSQGETNEVLDENNALSDLEIANLALANLDLELWFDDGESGMRAVATSCSQYNTVEHLYYTAEGDGTYYIRVYFKDMTYGELLDETESFALVWNVIPEPVWIPFAFALCGLFYTAFRRRKIRAQ